MKDVSAKNMEVINMAKYETQLRHHYDEDLFPFDSIFDDFFPTTSRRTSEMLKTDILEDNEHYTLKMEVPGIKKENIKMSYEDGYLTVSCTKNEENDEKSHHKYVRKERYFGSYSRSFYIGEMKEDQIDASLNNGVLTIRLPKEAQKAPEKKFIEIK